MSRDSTLTLTTTEEAMVPVIDTALRDPTPLVWHVLRGGLL